MTDCYVENMRIVDSLEMLLRYILPFIGFYENKKNMKGISYHINRFVFDKMRYRGYAHVNVSNVAVTRNNRLDIWRNIKNDIV